MKLCSASQTLSPFINTKKPKNTANAKITMAKTWLLTFAPSAAGAFFVPLGAGFVFALESPPVLILFRSDKDITSAFIVAKSGREG